MRAAAVSGYRLVVMPGRWVAGYVHLAQQASPFITREEVIAVRRRAVGLPSSAVEEE